MFVNEELLPRAKKNGRFDVQVNAERLKRSLDLEDRDLPKLAKQHGMTTHCRKMNYGWPHDVEPMSRAGSLLEPMREPRL